MELLQYVYRHHQHDDAQRRVQAVAHAAVAAVQAAAAAAAAGSAVHGAAAAGDRTGLHASVAGKLAAVGAVAMAQQDGVDAVAAQPD